MIRFYVIFSYFMVAFLGCSPDESGGKTGCEGIQNILESTKGKTPSQEDADRIRKKFCSLIDGLKNDEKCKIKTPNPNTPGQEVEQDMDKATLKSTFNCQ